MDYETVSPSEFGAALKGFGLNLLVRDVGQTSAFLSGVFGMHVHRKSRDFAIFTTGGALFQIHADHTYHAHPLPSLLPEVGARGVGIELRLYDIDPDEAAARAEIHGAHILQMPTDKPHGLREAVILCPDGYAWVPSRPL